MSTNLTATLNGTSREEQPSSSERVEETLALSLLFLGNTFIGTIVLKTENYEKTRQHFAS